MSTLILDEYDQYLAVHKDCTDKLRDLVEDLLKRNAIRYHQVTHRVKERDSLVKKLALPGKNYASLDDVTDICGIRVTTYFADDVDRVARLIEREFAVDWVNSSDKRAQIEPDRFGYLSIHHIASLSPDRLRLGEYERFEGIKVEIQTRSILQHAWAEIEHDLGYKSKWEVPQHIRRRFSRLAGLLELADEEFAGIRDSLAEYEASLEEAIATEPHRVPIDGATMRWFIRNDQLSTRVDTILSVSSGAPFVESDISPLLTAQSRLLGFATIADLRVILEELTDEVITLAKTWMPTSGFDATGVPWGTGLFYLNFIVAGSQGGEAGIRKLLENPYASILEPKEFEAHVRAYLSTVQAIMSGRELPQVDHETD